MRPASDPVPVPDPDPGLTLTLTLRATCERLRAKSRAIQQEAIAVERETREAALRALARKMDETGLHTLPAPLASACPQRE